MSLKAENKQRFINCTNLFLFNREQEEKKIENEIMTCTFALKNLLEV